MGNNIKYYRYKKGVAHFLEHMLLCIPEKDILNIKFNDILDFFNSEYISKNIQLSILGGDYSWEKYINQIFKVATNSKVYKYNYKFSEYIVKNNKFYMHKNINMNEKVYLYTNLWNLEKQGTTYYRDIENIVLYIIELGFSRNYTSDKLLIEIIRYSKLNKILRIRFQKNKLF